MPRLTPCLPSLFRLPPHQQVLPLGAIFFCASFNLTILQVRHNSSRDSRASAQQQVHHHDSVCRPALCAATVFAGGLSAAATASAHACITAPPPSRACDAVCRAPPPPPRTQSLKDAIMVTAGGAEALPFLASFCVLPASVGFFMLYGKLVRWLNARACAAVIADPPQPGACMPASSTSQLPHAAVLPAVAHPHAAGASPPARA